MAGGRVLSGTQVLRRLRRLGCQVVRQKGSHVIVGCGRCTTVVPVHKGRDLPKGTLAAIVRDLEPCIGKEWVQ
jgi:predicted RNA binding protein YcfA (HicA-like mRNA interferase family)